MSHAAEAALLRASSAYPPMYAPFKIASARLAVTLRRSRVVVPNAVTVVWGSLLVVAAVEIAQSSTGSAFALVLAAILLDCLDGDLARARGEPSVSGTLLEQVSHWIGNMALIAGAGAAVVLVDPRPGHVLVAAVAPVVQATYIAVVRQVGTEKLDGRDHPRVHRLLRVLVAALWFASPIELPLVVVLLVLGPTPTVLLAVVLVLAGASLFLFSAHFVLVRAADRRSSAAPTSAVPRSEARSGCAAQLLDGLPPVWWWTPRAPRLPAEVHSLLARTPMARDAPILSEVWRYLAERLPVLFRTSGEVLALAGPDELAMETVIGSICRSGDEVLLVGAPGFGRRWRSVAVRLGLSVTVAETAFGAGAIAAGIPQAPTGRRYRVACLPLATSDDGAVLDLPTLVPALREYADLVVVDAFLSLCADDLRTDEWGVDVVLSSSESGVMAPPGLSLVALGSATLSALDAAESRGRVARPGSYLDLRSHRGYARLREIPASAAVGLQISVRTILTKGLDAHLEERRRIAERFRLGCAEHAGMRTASCRPTSACTTVFLPDDLDLVRFQDALYDVSHMVSASGATPDGRLLLHFGHAGSVSGHDVDWAIDTVREAARRVREGTAQSK